ncbi:hypothetical protein TIFTF001_034708 [Ficus carica]|uniref:Uncharacterized protein n=1 Tax=Ficus carica TaxID=3494 RepID=A0AA88CGV4_FICCA|nr:hypothetical protein TIFTF001_048540 [Ficus carica]GMN28516.1 hypothetical protein TIFTF001_049458 [Ficus carica]GMN65636.1 hypothetical protein TIFTF001_034708 [Ficus carica]
MWSAMREALEAKYLLTKASACSTSKSLLTSPSLCHQAYLTKHEEPAMRCHVCQNWLVQQAWFALFTKLPNVTEQCNRPLA